MFFSEEVVKRVKLEDDGGRKGNVKLIAKMTAVVNDQNIREML